MTPQPKVIYIFWTCRDKQEAKKIIHGLLDQRLIPLVIEQSAFGRVQSAENQLKKRALY